MHYYIDGYNLLFRVFGGNDQTLQLEREKLIATLSRQIELLELDVTVVFDAQYFDSDEIRASHGIVKIVFTRLGQTADEYICKELTESKDPHRHIVVTSDRELARHARNFLASSESVETFIQWLHKRYRNKLHRPKQEPGIITPHSQGAIPHHADKAVTPKTAVKGSFNYYLEQFEQRFAQLPAEKISKSNKSSQAQKKQQKLPPPQPEEYLSDMERWLKIFEAEDKKSPGDDNESYKE